MQIDSPRIRIRITLLHLNLPMNHPILFGLFNNLWQSSKWYATMPDKFSFANQVDSKELPLKIQEIPATDQGIAILQGSWNRTSLSHWLKLQEMKQLIWFQWLSRKAFRSMTFFSGVPTAMATNRQRLTAERVENWLKYPNVKLRLTSSVIWTCQTPQGLRNYVEGFMQTMKGSGWMWLVDFLISSLKAFFPYAVLAFRPVEDVFRCLVEVADGQVPICINYAVRCMVYCNKP